MTDIELANSVIKDVQQQKYSNAAKTILMLLNNNAELGDNWGGITRLALSIGQVKMAIKASKRYLAVAPNEKKRVIQCAGIFAECREVSAGISLVKPLIDKENTPDVLHFLGTAYSQIGEFDLAKKYLTSLIKDVPQIAISWLTLAAIHTFTAEDELYKKLISSKQLFVDKKRSHNAPFWFALGKAQLDVKNENEAFNNFYHGCKLVHNEVTYNAKHHSKFIDQIIQNQNKNNIATLPVLNKVNFPSPIFIVGLPRSGTTLLQQILSAHSHVGQGGELKYLGFSSAEIGQKTLNKLTCQPVDFQLSTLNKMQADYQCLLSQQFDLDKPVVDKTLNLNHYLGMISRVFPNSAVIRIKRNAEDNAWSCFRNFFTEGLAWSYDLKNIATFFYHENRLAEHWNEVLGDYILEITYEDLVNYPKETLSLCLKHIGLEFEQGLLSFYKGGALVQTTSVGQVRKPINVSSLNKSGKVKKLLVPFTDHMSKLIED